MVELAELFSSMLGTKVYALNFPNYQKGKFIKVEIVSGVSESGGVADFNVQFMVKDDHPAKAEELALKIISTFKLVSDKEFSDGKKQLILMRSTADNPFYVGETQQGEFVFSVDFRILTTDI